MDFTGGAAAAARPRKPHKKAPTPKKGADDAPAPDVTVRFDVASLRRRRLAAASPPAVAAAAAAAAGSSRFLASSVQAGRGAAGAGPGAGAEGKEEREVAAESELERVFDKRDFAKMEVLGQFNLGFIICRLGDDLFIVDQHASDEIYNFERLQASTTLNRQPLLRPLPLDLSAQEQMVVSEHMGVFNRNGFEFVEDEAAPANERLKLRSVPFSKNTSFGVPDVQELIALVQQDGNQGAQATGGTRDLTITPGSILRPSRVRAMLAMRACRSSIMIGKALDVPQMERVLGHLSGLKAPWNCPHGRPTMRHLADLSKVKR